MTFVRNLYTYQGETITDSDLEGALKSLGITEGDILMVHSDTKSFGKLAASSAEELLGALADIFQKSVGSTGTIIMPTFTYSFGTRKENVFDREKTKSTVGSLTEYFRHLPGVARTTQPMMSVAVWGTDSNTMMDIGKDTLGPGTIFDNLRKHKGKIVLFGTDFTSCTFLHYVEQMHTVPYRFMKTFTGTIIDHGRSYEDNFQYFARPLEGALEHDFSRVESHLRKKGLLRETTVGAGRIMLVSAEDLYTVAMGLLDNDPYALVERTSKEHEK